MFEDFTYERYESLIRTALQKRSFELYGTLTDKPHYLWRHDVDVSVHRALKLARIERSYNVRSTYFLLLTSEFYNIFEPEIKNLILEIVDNGHDVGLHFDFSSVPEDSTVGVIESEMKFQKNTLESLLKTEVRSVSFHNPELRGALSFDKELVAGMINAYGARLREGYKYCSDSNGYWRYDSLFDVVENTDHEFIQAVTHPVWWSDAPMPPREKVKGAIFSRAEKRIALYDQALLMQGRLNIDA